MDDSSSAASPPVGTTPEDRLDSWKEIAAYFKRDVTTVQRWERREGMPVRRHVHDKLGSVYAFRSELNAWARSRNLAVTHEAVEVEPRPDLPDRSTPVVEDAQRIVESRTISPSTSRRFTRSTVAWSLTAGGLLLALVATWWILDKTDYFWRNPL